MYSNSLSTPIGQGALTPSAAVQSLSSLALTLLGALDALGQLLLREERVEAAAQGGADESEGGKRRSTICQQLSEGFLNTFTVYSIPGYLTYIK